MNIHIGWCYAAMCSTFGCQNHAPKQTSFSANYTVTAAKLFDGNVSTATKWMKW